MSTVRERRVYILSGLIGGLVGATLALAFVTRF